MNNLQIENSRQIETESYTHSFQLSINISFIYRKFIREQLNTLAINNKEIILQNEEEKKWLGSEFTLTIESNSQEAIKNICEKIDEKINIIAK